MSGAAASLESSAQRGEDAGRRGVYEATVRKGEGSEWEGTGAAWDATVTLTGVRFAALKAPGPSGMRPEHMAELLGTRRRMVAGRLLRALNGVLSRIEAGDLPEAGRWITRSRTTFLVKKSGVAPRPIKSRGGFKCGSDEATDAPARG